MTLRLALTACVATLVLLFADMSAQAQLAPGYSGQSSAPRLATREETWEMNRLLGQCLVRTKRAKAVEYLMTEPGSDAEGSAFDKLFSRHRNVCMRDFVSASLVRSHLRGTIAEALYEHSVPLPAHFTLSGSDAINTIYDFALCYIKEHGLIARKLLSSTKLGTKEEAAFVKALASDFGPCLPQGVEVRLVPTEIRLALAEMLWKSLAVPESSGVEASK